MNRNSIPQQLTNTNSSAADPAASDPTSQSEVTKQLREYRKRQNDKYKGNPSDQALEQLKKDEELARQIWEQEEALDQVQNHNEQQKAKIMTEQKLLKKEQIEREKADEEMARRLQQQWEVEDRDRAASTTHETPTDEELARILQQEEAEHLQGDGHDHGVGYEDEDDDLELDFPFAQSPPVRYTSPPHSPYSFPFPFQSQSQSQSHHPMNAPSLVPGIPAGMYSNEHHDALRQILPLLRAMTPPRHPLDSFLTALTHSQQFTSPHRRILFPTYFRSFDGAENLPTELRQMMLGHEDTSYERLLQLADMIQPVSRGANHHAIQSLPTRKYTKASQTSSADSRCNICLSEYEEGDTLKSLPSCLHSFHEDCINKWLQINKSCPVCRQEIQP